jgi:hypothetical protein
MGGEEQRLELILALMVSVQERVRGRHGTLPKHCSIVCCLHHLRRPRRRKNRNSALSLSEVVNGLRVRNGALSEVVNGLRGSRHCAAQHERLHARHAGHRWHRVHMDILADVFVRCVWLLEWPRFNYYTVLNCQFSLRMPVDWCSTHLAYEAPSLVS